MAELTSEATSEAADVADSIIDETEAESCESVVVDSGELLKLEGGTEPSEVS